MSSKISIRKRVPLCEERCRLLLWNEPRGGFYLRLTLPEETDATRIVQLAIEGGAVFVIGKTFDPAGKRNNSLRLSYCNNTPEQIAEGIPIVARAIRQVCG